MPEKWNRDSCSASCAGFLGPGRAHQSCGTHDPAGAVPTATSADSDVSWRHVVSWPASGPASCAPEAAAGAVRPRLAPQACRFQVQIGSCAVRSAASTNCRRSRNVTESARLALTVTKIDMAGTLSEACKRAALQPGGGPESAGNRDRVGGVVLAAVPVESEAGGELGGHVYSDEAPRGQAGPGMGPGPPAPLIVQLAPGQRRANRRSCW